MNVVLVALGVACVAAGFIMVVANKANDRAGGSGLGKFSIEGPTWLVLVALGIAATGWGAMRWEDRHPIETKDRLEVASTTPLSVPIDEVFPTGFTFGDNNELDRLWRSCERSVWADCDLLYELSDIGSDYELFGYTCGGLPFNPNPDTEWCEPTRLD